jgi:hypothetical protein
MANYNIRLFVQVTDINGDVAEVSAPAREADTTTLAALATAVGGLASAVAQASNGKVTRQGFHVLVNEAQYLVGTAPPNNAEYSSVTDGAKFNFADGAGERSSMKIPAPLEALFGVNSNVIDSTQTNSLAVINWFTANASSTSGTAFNLYKGGAKTGKGTRRRATKLIP